MPDWWDQDEGNDGVLDIHDIKMGGTYNLSVCGWTAGNLGQGFVLRLLLCPCLQDASQRRERPIWGTVLYATGRCL